MNKNSLDTFIDENYNLTKILDSIDIDQNLNKNDYKKLKNYIDNSLIIKFFPKQKNNKFRTLGFTYTKKELLNYTKADAILSFSQFNNKTLYIFLSNIKKISPALKEVLKVHTNLLKDVYKYDQVKNNEFFNGNKIIKVDELFLNSMKKLKSEKTLNKDFGKFQYKQFRLCSININVIYKNIEENMKYIFTIDKKKIEDNLKEDKKFAEKFSLLKEVFTWFTSNQTYKYSQVFPIYTTLCKSNVGEEFKKENLPEDSYDPDQSITLSNTHFSGEYYFIFSKDYQRHNELNFLDQEEEIINKYVTLEDVKDQIKHLEDFGFKFDLKIEKISSNKISNNKFNKDDEIDEKFKIKKNNDDDDNDDEDDENNENSDNNSDDNKSDGNESDGNDFDDKSTDPKSIENNIENKIENNIENKNLIRSKSINEEDMVSDIDSDEEEIPKAIKKKNKNKKSN